VNKYKVKIKANISWSGNNFCATVDKQVPGCIVVTDKSFEGVKKALLETIQFHVEGMLADGDAIPEWLASGGYKIEWVVEISALIRRCENLTTLAAIARATGINQRQLSHYANGKKEPREAQRLRIIEGIRHIGQEMLSLG